MEIDVAANVADISAKLRCHTALFGLPPNQGLDLPNREKYSLRTLLRNDRFQMAD